MSKNLKRFDRNRISLIFPTQEMEELNNQMQQIIVQLKTMSEKSAEHETALAYMNQKLNEKELPKVEVQENRVDVDLFRIPDPIKSIPKYEGNRKQLTAWLQTAEDTLRVFAPLVTEAQFTLYLQCVLNKIEGKAKDILCLAGNPKTFEQIKVILTEALGDRQELSYYKAQLWATKQSDNMTVHSYFKTTKEIVQNIKTQARRNATYNNSWPAINAFIEEDALASFIAGLRKPYFGYAQAAKPRDIEEAYAFLCKFSANELISGNSKKLGNSAQNIQYKMNNTPQFIQNRSNDVQVHQKPNVFRKPTYSVKEPGIPMEVDTSLRSRRTFNRNHINNHEFSKEIEEIDTNLNIEYPQEEEEETSGNFQENTNSDTED